MARLITADLISCPSLLIFVITNNGVIPEQKGFQPVDPPQAFLIRARCIRATHMEVSAGRRPGARSGGMTTVDGSAQARVGSGDVRRAYASAPPLSSSSP